MRLLRACLILLPLLAGCRAEDEIKLDTITHEDREPIRLRIGILEHDKHVWFVRIDGPAELVKEHQPAFDAFVKSAKFNDKAKDDPLTFTEPKEWKKDPPGGGRYASYRIKAGTRELEVKVTPMPAKEFKEGIMRNVHRWQGQVHVPLSESHKEFKEKHETIEKVGTLEIAWVDMIGLGVHTNSRPPDANAGKENNALAMNDDGLPFKYAAPDGWVQQPAGKFAADAYRVGQGKQSAEVTITRLSGPMAANVAENINRWRGQVKLPKLGGAELGKTVVNKKVAGVKSYYVDLANPDAPPGENHILGVIVPINRSTCWFIKMTGPLDYVAEQKPAFEAFVDSFKKK